MFLNYIANIWLDTCCKQLYFLEHTHTPHLQKYKLFLFVITQILISWEENFGVYI